MRALEFEDASFDFCYSSCAMEHIGKYDDFLEHLREVRRVLEGRRSLRADDGVPLRRGSHSGAAQLLFLVGLSARTGEGRVVRDAQWSGRRGVAPRLQPAAAAKPGRSVRRSRGCGNGHASEVRTARAATHRRSAFQLPEPGSDETCAGRLDRRPAHGRSRRFTAVHRGRSAALEGLRRKRATESRSVRSVRRAPPCTRDSPPARARTGNARCFIPATCGWAARRAQSR